MKLNLESEQKIIDQLEIVYDLINAKSSSDIKSLACFIKRHYPTLDTDDIVKAFEMAFSNSLNVEIIQTGGLNAQKIGKVLTAFRNYKHQQNRALYSESEKPDPPIEELQRLERVFENDMCTEFEKYKNTGRHDFLLRVVAYDHLEKKGIIEKDNYLQFQNVDSLADKKQGFINSTVFVSTNSAKMKRIAFNNFFKQLAIDGKSLRDMFVKTEIQHL